MSKGLEEIKRRLINDDWLNEDGTGVYSKEFAEIEQELKDYYALKKECEEAKWYQEHKALKIIKETCTFEFEEKDIMVHKKIIKVYQVVINGVLTLDLTQEEYDLLKEMLL